jgi:hypothetical protein
MSMVRGFTGVPSKLTRPVTPPFSGRAEVRVNIEKTAAAATSTFLICICLLLLIS